MYERLLYTNINTDKLSGMKKIILTILLTFFYVFFATSVSAATYYISTTGNDINSGTQTSPWRTIQKAANTLNSNDIAIVSAGTYDETVAVSRSGIVFQTNGVVTMKGFYITGNNTTVTEFIVNDSPGYGVELRGSNSTIKNSTIAKARNACIFVAGQNNLIENNECSNTIQPTTNGGDADCFRYFGGGHTFRGNYCHDIPWDGVLVRDAHTDCFQTWNWTSIGGVGHDILFEKNVCILPFSGGGFGAKIWQAEEGAYNLIMKNNIGVAGLIALIFDGTNISFLNNTFIGYTSDSDGLHLQSTDITLKNNIFAHQQQRVIENIGSSSTITASNNCYMDYGIILPADPGDVRGTDPLFVNEPLRNYHLQSDSPCVDKGSTISSITDDKDGISRPQGSGYDMGAHEFVSTSSTPTSIPGCSCNSAGTCTDNCIFDKFTTPITYPNPMKCSLSSSLFTTDPSVDNKMSWCQRSLRSKGDSDGDGLINLKDYFYYVSANVGGKIPVTVNPDFDGSGAIEANDTTIIIKSLKQ